MGRFEAIEHTADKGLEVHAATLEELFATAAYGLFTLMVDPAQYPALQETEIEIRASDPQVLLVKWLNELLYRFEVHKQLPSRFEILELRPDHLRVRVGYRVVTPEAIEWDGAPVKSVTYHHLQLEPKAEGWYLRFYVDV